MFEIARNFHSFKVLAIKAGKGAQNALVNLFFYVEIISLRKYLHKSFCSTIKIQKYMTHTWPTVITVIVFLNFSYVSIQIHNKGHSVALADLNKFTQLIPLSICKQASKKFNATVTYLSGCCFIGSIEIQILNISFLTWW